MGKKSPTGPEKPVTPQIREYLSANGRKGAHIGGQISKRLIELGKEKAEEQGEDWREEFEESQSRTTKKRKAA